MINFSEEELSAIYLSLKIALTHLFLVLPFDLMGYIFARKKFLKKFFISLFNLPLVLPPVVTGYVYL